MIADALGFAFCAIVGVSFGLALHARGYLDGMIVGVGTTAILMVGRWAGRHNATPKRST